jgi:predicted nucleic acid-binding protein
MDAVLLDTCVLLKSYLCDTLLSIAEAGAFRPLWSDDVLAELRRNLVRAGAKQEAIEHRLGQMAASFPDARVTGYESFIGSMTNHPKDRHVLAAAVAGRADVLVTENLRDFPAESIGTYGITVASQDEFLLGRLELYPGEVLDALRRQASRYRREPRTVRALLDILGGQGQGCPQFASQCRALL